MPIVPETIQPTRSFPVIGVYESAVSGGATSVEPAELAGDCSGAASCASAGRGTQTTRRSRRQRTRRNDIPTIIVDPGISTFFIVL
jgi:hypothetical protein